MIHYACDTVVTIRRCLVLVPELRKIESINLLSVWVFVTLPYQFDLKLE